MNGTESRKKLRERIVRQEAELDRLSRGVAMIRDYLSEKSPRVGDASFTCDALLAGSEYENAALGETAP